MIEDYDPDDDLTDDAEMLIAWAHEYLRTHDEILCAQCRCATRDPLYRPDHSLICRACDGANEIEARQAA